MPDAAYDCGTRRCVGYLIVCFRYMSKKKRTGLMESWGDWARRFIGKPVSCIELMFFLFRMVRRISHRVLTNTILVLTPAI